ncbi:MAG: DNA-directed RNA polymerase subunit alpha [bacterium]
MDNNNIFEPIPLPNEIKVENAKGNSADIIIQPCFPGFGNTIGNALRRVLLSSLSGSAVTSVKIKGVDHEFSSIDNVKEDVLSIILNLKGLNLKVHSDEPVRMKINASGKKEIKASDIETTSDVEIVEKDHHIATLTHPDSKLEMEIVADRGRGYVPVEQKDKKELEVGMILIDSIYSPVIKVGYHIDNMRVGQMTNFNRITLKVTTDGSVSPKDAVKQSAEILINHFQKIVNPAEVETKAEKKIKKKEKEENDEKTEITIEDLKLSARTKNALVNGNLNSINDICKKSSSELMDLEGFGARALDEVRSALDKKEIKHMLDS